MSLAECEQIFVGGLRSARRVHLMNCLRTLCEELRQTGIPCSIWINGSFVCAKEEPSDVDVAIIVHSTQMEGLSQEAEAYLARFEDNASEYYMGCLDVFFCIEYPAFHDLYDPDDTPESWAQQWSRTHSEMWLKGFAILEAGFST